MLRPGPRTQGYHLFGCYDWVTMVVLLGISRRLLCGSVELGFRYISCVAGCNV